MAQEQYFGNPSMVATAEKSVSLSSIAPVMTIGHFQKEKLIPVRATFKRLIAKFSKRRV
jgi:hypothetical protein